MYRRGQFRPGAYVPHSANSDHALWASVVLQARADIEDLPIGSTDYEAAVAFFTSSSPYWRRGRDDIAEHLNTTGETLQRIGRAWVIARRRRAGLPDHPPAPAPRSLPKPAPTVIEAAPLFVPAVLANCLQPRRRRAPADNPFSPFRKFA